MIDAGWISGAEGKPEESAWFGRWITNARGVDLAATWIERPDYALLDSRLTVQQVSLDSGGRQRVSQAESPIGARVLVLTEDLPRPVFGCLSFTTMVLASKMFPDI